MAENTTTPFQVIYQSFLGKITDDMYMEWTPEDTYADLKNILIAAIPYFEFPRFPLFNYDLEMEYISDNAMLPESTGAYLVKLTNEEIDILSHYMMYEWLGRQIASVENTRMKYSGSDFKFTSQANHLDKLLKLQTAMKAQGIHKQRIYKRRKIDPETGEVKSNLSVLVGGVL